MVDYKKLNTDDDEETLVLDTPLVVKRTKKKKNSRKRCSACKICMILFLTLFGLIVAFAGLGYMIVRHYVISSSVTTPVSLPILEISDAELDIVRDRTSYFVYQLSVGLEPTDDLVVTQREINGLIADNDYLRGNAYVDLENGHVASNWSLPLDLLPGGRGRYLVAYDDVTLHKEDEEVSVELDVPVELKKAPKDLPLAIAVFKYAVHDSKVSAYIHSLKVLGKDKGGDAAHQDVLDGLYSDPDIGPILEHIESVSIKKGSIVFTPRRKKKTSATSNYVDALDTAEHEATEKSMYLRKPKNP